MDETVYLSQKEVLYMKRRWGLTEVPGLSSPFSKLDALIKRKARKSDYYGIDLHYLYQAKL